MVAPKYTSFPPFGMDQFIMILSWGHVEALFEIQKYHHSRESNFHWTGQNVIIFGTPLTVPQTRIMTRGLAYIPLHKIRFKHNCFPSTAEM